MAWPQIGGEPGTKPPGLWAMVLLRWSQAAAKGARRIRRWRIRNKGIRRSQLSAPDLTQTQRD